MENRSWLVHFEWVVVLVTLLGGFYMIDGKIERGNARTDRLYEMYVENNEKANEKWEKSNEKWQDLLIKYSEIKCENSRKI